MDVDKIQKLSEQYKLLRKFQNACNSDNIDLGTMFLMIIELDDATSKSIFDSIRVIIPPRIKELEKKIKEAANG